MLMIPRDTFCGSQQNTFLFSPSVKNEKFSLESALNKLLCGYLQLLNMTPVRDADTHTHTHIEKHKARNSVVFVLSELCLFKGGLVCEAEALNNN